MKTIAWGLFGLLLLFSGEAMAGPIAAALPVAMSILGSSTAASVGMGLAGSLLGKAMSPKAPKTEAPKVMPTADDAAVAAAKRRQVAEVQNRGGRASTILSESDKLGG